MGSSFRGALRRVYGAREKDVNDARRIDAVGGTHLLLGMG